MRPPKGPKSVFPFRSTVEITENFKPLINPELLPGRSPSWAKNIRKYQNSVEQSKVSSLKFPLSTKRSCENFIKELKSKDGLDFLNPACENESKRDYFFYFMKSCLLKYDKNKHRQAKLEYLTWGC